MKLKSHVIEGESFSNWIEFDERNDVPKRKYPGVYLLAISSKNLNGKKPSFKDVVYIGCTKSKKGLAGRWGQLNRALEGTLNQHSGGHRIFTKHGRRSNWGKRKLKLYVSALVVECSTENPGPEDLRRMGEVVYLEYEALASYMKNSKGKWPPFDSHR